jgi:hypothetical protein
VAGACRAGELSRARAVHPAASRSPRRTASRPPALAPEAEREGPCHIDPPLRPLESFKGRPSPERKEPSRSGDPFRDPAARPTSMIVVPPICSGADMKDGPGNARSWCRRFPQALSSLTSASSDTRGVTRDRPAGIARVALDPVVVRTHAGLDLQQHLENGGSWPPTDQRQGGAIRSHDPRGVRTPSSWAARTARLPSDARPIRRSRQGRSRSRASTASRRPRKGRAVRTPSGPAAPQT